MPDHDTAHTVPESGKMELVNEALLNETQVFVHSELHWHEGQKTPQILVVEDDASLAHLEANVLTAHGYAVAIAGNGELALTALSQAVPDLVVLDLELPGNLNGWDVLRVLRRQTSIPVLLTTSSDKAMRKHMRNSGETRLTLDHLPKPYPMQTLLKRIKRMLMIAPK